MNTGDSWSALQGGWRDRIWSSCFAGVLSLEELVDVPLMQAERRHCGRGGERPRGVRCRGPGFCLAGGVGEMGVAGMVSGLSLGLSK